MKGDTHTGHGLTYGSLFSAVGGLEMGVQQVLPGKTLWHSDIDPGACKVLAHRWPDVPNLGDIIAVDWATVPRVDVLTGGSPCQDVSSAGKRAGMTEGTRSNLWVAMRDAIEHLRPSLVVWENVRGALNARAASDLESREGRVGEAGEPALRALGRVLGDLADLRYDTCWFGLRADDVGAPHRRFRVFVFASPADSPNIGHEWAWGARRRGTGPADSGRALASNRSKQDGGERWGRYAAAVARWETVLGRPAPTATEPAPRGGHRLSPEFASWLMGYPEGHITGVPGITRNEAIRCAGNGVVPQQAAEATRRALHYMTSMEGS